MTYRRKEPIRSKTPEQVKTFNHIECTLFRLEKNIDLNMKTATSKSWDL
jgi:hypothetical protein